MRVNKPTQIKDDYRLIEIFGQSQYQRWKDECPEYLAYQSFEISKGHYVDTFDHINPDEYGFEKLESLDPINFPIDEPDFFKSPRFNPYRYNVHRSYLHRKYYLIGKSKKVLVLYSGEELRKIFNSLEDTH